MPWADKLPIAFWRGAATGAINNRHQAARYHLLTRWAHASDPRIDVGMNFLPMSTGNATRDAVLKSTIKPSMQPGSMQKYRYLISAEGYDVATNLKWVLWSASAVIMPRPTVCSWFMEDRLVPWVHYVPVTADFSNLTAAVDWCENVRNAGLFGLRCLFRTFIPPSTGPDGTGVLRLYSTLALRAIRPAPPQSFSARQFRASLARKALHLHSPTSHGSHI